MSKGLPKTIEAPQFREWYMAQTYAKKTETVEKLASACHLAPITVRQWVSQTLNIHPRYFSTINKITKTQMFQL